MHLYLVRHAKPEANSGDSPLGTEGVEQASMLGELFKGLNPSHESLRLLSSSASRARQTAEAICDKLGISSEELGIFPAPIDNIPGMDLSDRLMQRLRKITTDEGRNQIIVIGHWDYIGKAIALLIGDPAFKLQNIYGVVACLECQNTFMQGEGNLRWLVLPLVATAMPN